MDELLSETVSLAESETIYSNPPEPKSIGSGIVKNVLGKGGASVVYEIWNPKLEIYRAVKLWRPSQSEKTIQRFENEIKITAKLHHPNIVDIYTVGEWNGLPYIEMEKVQGTNLKDLIKKQGALPEPVVCAVAISICRALIYAHNHEYSLSGKEHKGVVHCDIKPANIMISDKGVVKLMDFGIAHPSDHSKVAEKSIVTGSLQYMSPEQLESRPIDLRSDLYSLGVLLYELYSGTKAFPASSLKELIQKRNNNEFSPLGAFCKGLSSRARAIVEKLMQIDPDKRFQSASELLEEFQKIYSKITQENPEIIISRFMSGEKLPKNKSGRNSFRAFIISMLIVLPVIVFAAFYQWNKTQYAQPSAPQQNSSADSSGKSSDTRKPADSFTVKSKTSTPAHSRSTSKSTASTHKKVPQKAAGGTKTTTPTVKGLESVFIQEPPKEETLEPVNDGTILDEMSRLIRAGQLAQAQKLIHEFPLNDGEYHLVNAELLFKKRQLNAAKLESEKALRIPAARISPSELREKVLYFKARILSAEFDNEPDKEKGHAAMEAWYEIKYLYRASTSNSHYIKADAEIRRISASIQ